MKELVDKGISWACRKFDSETNCEYAQVVCYWSQDDANYPR